MVITGGGVAARNGASGKLARPAGSTTESGLGDVLLKGSYVLVQEQDLIPEIAPYVKIKFPTADEDRGLGTGEFDETFGADLSKRLFEKLFGYLTLSYTFIGDPPGTDFRNSFGWSIGAAYAVMPPLSVFAFLEGSTAIARGQADPVELRVGAEYKLTKVRISVIAISQIGASRSRRSEDRDRSEATARLLAGSRGQVIQRPTATESLPTARGASSGAGRGVTHRAAGRGSDQPGSRRLGAVLFRDCVPPISPVHRALLVGPAVELAVARWGWVAGRRGGCREL